MSRNRRARYLRQELDPKRIERPDEGRTEREKTRRAARDWLRERDEDDVPEFGDPTEFV